jgi:Raf kinase inhibitor-like YbhB/YbcL family protein
MLTLTSSAFENNETIPSKYTCDGDGELSPPLLIGGVPDGTKSLVLIMDDPDIPQVFKDSRGIDAFDHWVLFNIPPETREIGEGASTQNIFSAGLNGAGKIEYARPCPPPQYEPREHRYIFSLYALSDILHFDNVPTAEKVRDELKPILIAETKLVGRYAR